MSQVNNGNNETLYNDWWDLKTNLCSQTAMNEGNDRLISLDLSAILLSIPGNQKGFISGNQNSWMLK